jgi:predicted acylesterase/phospholipase RssA
MESAMRECDLIMKGGITSGVVYPFAIVELAKAYRLRSIGGASAGAIAAVMAAGAEYRRQASPGKDDMSGFVMIGDMAEELAADMQSLFQPAPQMAGLFGIMMSSVSGGGMFGAIWRAHRAQMVAAGAVGGALVLGGLATGNVALVVLGLLVGALVGVIAIGLALKRTVTVDLPAHDFGICPGATMPGAVTPALTEWIADRIDMAAGNLGPDGALGAPLTVGQLQDQGIEVASMTTDLSSQRPYQLPLQAKHHFFSRAEFAALFPARVVDAMCADTEPRAHPGGPQDLYPLPVGADFPVVLCARMSLSFPGLISAVPLWRKDWQVAGPDGEKGVMRRCLFSDGGISSNFPIHFFDALLPRRPTFGISLTAWDAARHGDERVHLSNAPMQSTDLPIRPLKGFGGFVFAILNTAKDWQDTLQSKLPGYAERIVEIRLDPAKEGGMNLAMDKATIDALSEYGRQAGVKLVEEFDFDENRWRRALSLLPNLEHSLQGFADSLAAVPAGMEGGKTYAQVLTDHDPQRYKDNSDRWRAEVLAPFAANLAALGTAATDAADDRGRRTVQEGDVPSQDATVRVTAEADRRPES